MSCRAASQERGIYAASANEVRRPLSIRRVEPGNREAGVNAALRTNPGIGFSQSTRTFEWSDVYLRGERRQNRRMPGLE